MIVVLNVKNATQNSSIKRIENYKNDKKWKNFKVTLLKYKHLFFWSFYQNQKDFFLPEIQTTTKFCY